MIGKIRFRVPRFQFRLGTLLLVVAVIAALLGIHVVRTNRQRAAVRAIKLRLGDVGYDFQFGDDLRLRRPPGKPPAPTWLVEWLGVDHFADVAFVSIDGSLRFERPPPPWLEHLISLPNLQILSLWHMRFTDTELAGLARFSRLREFWLLDCDRMDQLLSAIRSTGRCQPHAPVPPVAPNVLAPDWLRSPFWLPITPCETP